MLCSIAEGMEAEAPKLSAAAHHGLTWIKECTILEPTSVMALLFFFSEIYEPVWSPKLLY